MILSRKSSTAINGRLAPLLCRGGRYWNPSCGVLSSQTTTTATTTTTTTIFISQRTLASWFDQRLARYGSNQSSLPSPSNTTGSGNDGGGMEVGNPIHPQPFVKIRIHPGEWDPKRTDPLYRPKFRGETRIICAEDFERRPKVGVSEYFDNFDNGMVVLSWITHDLQREVYALYCQLLESADENEQTSHEYVVRVVAQKFHLSLEKVSGIILLQHNEQQLLKQQEAGVPGIDLNHGLERVMDIAHLEAIDEAYEDNRMRMPSCYVEPVDRTPARSRTMAHVDDIFEVDKLTKDAIVRDEQNARMKIDGYIYDEDVELDTIQIPLSDDCKTMIRDHALIREKVGRVDEVQPEPELGAPLPAEGVRRDRWKFVAQIINTRDLKKQRSGARNGGRKFSCGFRNNSLADTVVEHNGTLRAATKADVVQTAWKPVKNLVLKAVDRPKQAWVERRFRGKSDGWGMSDTGRKELQESREVIYDSDDDDYYDYEEYDDGEYDDEEYDDDDIYTDEEDGEDNDEDGDEIEVENAEESDAAGDEIDDGDVTNTEHDGDDDDDDDEK